SAAVGAADGAAGLRGAACGADAGRSPRPLARRARSRQPPAALSVQLHDLHGGVRWIAAAAEAGDLPADDRDPVRERRARGAARVRGRPSRDARDSRGHESRLSPTVTSNSKVACFPARGVSSRNLEVAYNDGGWTEQLRNIARHVAQS